MKKMKTAVGVAVALAVLWTGASWLTGKQIERHKDQLIQNLNAQLNNLSPDSHLVIGYQNYRRGLFSSRAQLVIQPRPQLSGKLLMPGQRVVLNEIIDHGPLPAAQLKKFNFIPAMASLHSGLENNDTVAKLFAAAEGKSLFQADTRIGYNGSSASDIQLLPVDFQDEQTGKRYVWDSGKIEFNSDARGNKLDFSGSFNNIALSKKSDADGALINYALNGLSFASASHGTAQDIRTGKQRLAIKRLTASADAQELMVLDGFQLHSGFDGDGNTLSGQISYALDKIKLKNYDFGSSKLAMKISQLDARAVKTFTDNYNRQLRALLNQPGINRDPEAYSLALQQIYLTNLPVLLQGNPVITIAPLSWKNDKGESTLNLTARLRDPGATAKPAETLATLLDQRLKMLEGKLVINMPMATAAVKQIAQIEGYQASEAEKLADQQVQGVAAMGQMFRLTTRQDDNILTSLQYEAGQVNINGEKMTLAQFLSCYLPGSNALILER